MKNLFLLLSLFLCSCSFSVSYESVYRIKVNTSSAYRFETTLTDGTKQSIQTQASGTYTLCSKTLSLTEQEVSSLSDDDFRKQCPLPSTVIKEINIFSVTSSSETATATPIRTISVDDSQWPYRRLARNMGAYIYELK